MLLPDFLNTCLNNFKLVQIYDKEGNELRVATSLEELKNRLTVKTNQRSPLSRIMTKTKIVHWEIESNNILSIYLNIRLN